MNRLTAAVRARSDPFAGLIFHKRFPRLSADIPLRQERHYVETAARILVDRA
jgi:hypothetical protein